MDSSLVERSLQMAIDTRDIGNNLLFHSDQGSQYQSTNVQQLLCKHNIQQSMSRRGNCYDNAVTESFFSTLKKETTHAKPILSTYLTEEITKEYIQNYYNIIRGHSHNDYVSPFIKEVLYFREHPNV
jgi:transposase InsO family protein